MSLNRDSIFSGNIERLVPPRLFTLPPLAFFAVTRTPSFSLIKFTSSSNISSEECRSCRRRRGGGRSRKTRSGLRTGLAKSQEELRCTTREIDELQAEVRVLRPIVDASETSRQEALENLKVSLETAHKVDQKQAIKKHSTV
ncbi:hypothetical protein F4860DRAFT_518693 [Xylaria cubensis]|nr:hypothetical protein F4860DRAFT_518693 [Xylaria cubensis]